MTKISAQYNWLGDIKNPPRMMAEAIKLGKLDTTEKPGKKSNREIMALAKEADVEKIYTSDEIAWCAVAMVALALRSGKKVAFTGYDRLRAKSFLKFGSPIEKPEFGDVLVFDRPGGGHVGLYVGEDTTSYHVAGGNQANQFSVVRILKTRVTQARRPDYSIGKPTSVKQIFLSATGIVSQNEA
jgi:uncharacterized protein (TIGR02594 family)